MGWARRVAHGAAWLACGAAFAAATSLAPVQIPADRVGSTPSHLIVAGDALYFSADDGFLGRELWRYDAEGRASLVVDTDHGAGSGDPGDFVESDGILYFTSTVRDYTGTARQLFAVDRQGAVVSFHPYQGAVEFFDGVGVGGQLYFVGGFIGKEPDLWMADAATGSLAAVAPPGGVSRRGVALSGELFRVGPHAMLPITYPADAEGLSMWCISPGDNTPRPAAFHGSPREGDMIRGYSMQFVGPGGSYVMSSRLGGSTVWRVDPERGDLHHAFDLGPGTTRYGGHVLPMPGYQLLRHEEPGAGLELWIADEHGPRMLKDIHAGVGSSGPHKLTPFGDRVAFVADDGVHGSELWITDGTREGTRMIVDMVPGPVRSDPYSLHVHGDLLLFSGNHNRHGEELWATDGTAEGTRLLGDIHAGPASSEPYYLTTFGDAVYFCANSAGRGFELWRTDGTPEGTRIAAAIAPRTRMVLGAEPRELTVVGERLFFSAMGASGERGLWTGGATPADMREITGLLPADAAGEPRELRTMSEGLVVTTTDSDGVAAHFLITPNADRATRIDAPPAEEKDCECLDREAYDATFDDLPWPPEGARLGDRFLFRGYSVDLGYELWWSDCAVGAPRLLRDLLPGPGSSSPEDFTVYRSLVLFRAYDVNVGAELWASDGTPEGTLSPMDHLPTPRSGVPTDLQVWNDTLIFTHRTDHDWYAIGSVQIDPDSRIVSVDFPPAVTPGPIRELRIAGDRIFYVTDYPGLGGELFSTRLDIDSFAVPANLRPNAVFDPGAERWWPSPAAPVEAKP